MSKKTSLLVKDIAQLLVKYRLDDWLPVLTQLKSGAIIHQEIASSIEDLLEIARKRSKRSPSKPKRKAKSLPTRSGDLRLSYPISDRRAKTLEPLRAALLNKTLLPTVSNLREAYERLGLKQKVPSDRALAVELLIELLDVAPDNRFSKMIEFLADARHSKDADPGNDYRRWFDVITKDGGRTPSSS